jgi:hypothetical protein
MNCKYVRQYYSVPARIESHVTVSGKPGIIAEDRGHYIGVNFDADKPGVIRNVHPTFDVEYLGMGEIRKLTAAQQRYRDYLDVSECFDGFLHFLKSRAAEKKS